MSDEASERRVNGLTFREWCARLAQLESERWGGDVELIALMDEAIYAREWLAGVTPEAIVAKEGTH